MPMKAYIVLTNGRERIRPACWQMMRKCPFSWNIWGTFRKQTAWLSALKCSLVTWIKSLCRPVSLFIPLFLTSFYLPSSFSCPHHSSNHFSKAVVFNLAPCAMCILLITDPLKMPLWVTLCMLSCQQLFPSLSLLNVFARRIISLSINTVWLLN